MYYFDRKIQSIILYVDKIKSRFYKGGRRTSSSPHGTWYMNWGSLCSLARLFFYPLSIVHWPAYMGVFDHFYPSLWSIPMGPLYVHAPDSWYLADQPPASVDSCGFHQAEWKLLYWRCCWPLDSSMLAGGCTSPRIPLCPIHFVEGASMPWLTGHLPRLRALITGQG